MKANNEDIRGENGKISSLNKKLKIAILISFSKANGTLFFVKEFKLGKSCIRFIYLTINHLQL